MRETKINESAKMNENVIAAPLSRIPGTSQLKEQHSKDLKTLSYVQLLEIKDRQSNFLSFKKRLQRLPDKGKRLQESYDKLLEEIKRRDEVEEATRMLSGLNIAAKGKIALNNLEWNGRNTDEGAHVDDILDSDDEVEMDPLRIIAQGTMHEKKVKVIPPPASLITAEDLADIEEFKKPADSPDSALAGHSDTSSLPAEIIAIDASQVAAKLSKEQAPDQHSLYLIDKTETSVNAPSREKFMPFRTTKSNVHDPDKERVRKKGKHWEVTAATPPLIQHKEVQLVPLAESATLQMDYMQRLKEVRIQQAEQRLARHKESRLAAGLSLPEESILKTKESFRNYRDPQANVLIEGRQKACEANEVLDPSIQDRGVANSGIHYTVFE
ncbi:uncharacterized protein LOC108135805 [Drosophila elegans]|uniref:uncharacterized protein LOC108135805 n=1 Tax=Drosophila elegans TaxID=30023 RepID=UPI0007E64242|nr:uncharacterized protein LOC108135805 [Drosophila elegans]